MRLTNSPRLAAASCAGFLSLALVGWHAPPSPRTAPLHFVYRADFAGVADDGESDLWRGEARGDANGPLTLTLRQVGSPAESADSIWHVRTTWVASDPRAPLVGDLDGTVNWKRGTMTLTGHVTEGASKGARLEVSGSFLDFDAAGVMESVPLVASRDPHR